MANKNDGNDTGRNYITHKEITIVVDEKNYIDLLLENMPLPRTRVENEKIYYIQSNKSLQVRPEETVRQKVVAYLVQTQGVPINNIIIEDALTHHKKNESGRSDIIVMNGEESILLLVECKQPSVSINGAVAMQATDYNEVLHAKYVLLTNSFQSLVFQVRSDVWVPLAKLPTYKEMCDDYNIEPLVCNPVEFKRQARSEYDSEEGLFPYRHNGYEPVTKDSDVFEYNGGFLSYVIDSIRDPFIVNLGSAFMDLDDTIPSAKGYDIELLSDEGLVYAVIGNANPTPRTGYPGFYRKLIVKDRHNVEQIVYYSVFGVGKEKFSYLICGVEIDGHPESKLQINLNKKNYIIKKDSGFSILHDGAKGGKGVDRVTIPNFITEVCPDLMNNGRIDLGWLDDSCDIHLSDANGVDFLLRLCSYLLLRTELHKSGVFNNG